MVEAYQPHPKEGRRSSRQAVDRAVVEERHPLGERPYKIAISRDEMKIAFEHRKETGEPMQSWVRRLIRESATPVIASNTETRDIFVASRTTGAESPHPRSNKAAGQSR